MDLLNFDRTLAAMMERLGQQVRISVFNSADQQRAHVVDMEGELTAGWDPDVLEANGVGDAAIFRMAGAPGFSLYLVRDDFDDGRHIGDRLVFRTGGVTVAVSPAGVGS